MMWILLIFGALLLIAAFVFKYMQEDKIFYMAAEKKEAARKRVGKTVTALVLAGVICLVSSQMVVVIKTGYTGVRTTFGQISDQPVQNGFSIKIPFVQQIETVNNKLQDKTIEDQVWGETANRTAIWYKNIVVSYQIEPEKSAWIFANVADYKESLISNALVSSAIKSASATLQDAEATNRGMIEPAVCKALQDSVNGKYGERVLHINKVTINEADFEESYKTAIADKQKAQLAYEQQEIENKKNIEKANAEAEANRKLQESISPEVLQKQFLDKWNGEMPKVMDGNTMLDISSFVGN